MMASNQERIHEVEEALMLFIATLAGEPADATDEMKAAAESRMVQLMERIRARH